MPFVTGEPAASGSVAVFSRRMARIPHLEAFLGHKVALHPRGKDLSVAVAAGWGRKRSAERARDYAAARGLPYRTVEDGFLRSVGLGVDGAAAWSLVVDDLGVYFDATAPSQLEQLLDGADLGVDLLARAAWLRGALVEHKLSKYNDAPDAPVDLLPARGQTRVLLVDQTENDQSIRYGLAGPESFRDMLAAAADENPGADLIVKTHPDVIAGKKPSALAFARSRPGLRWLSNRVSPLSLLNQVERVYTVTSQLGFEALLLDKPVSCFGLPFYAGWGLTDDRVACPRRRRRRSLLELLAAAYILYPRYVDPVTGRRCEVEAIVDRLALQRKRFQETSGPVYAVGFSFWKRAYVRPFLASPWNRVRFVRNVGSLPRPARETSARCVVWAGRETSALRNSLADVRLPIWRMEDGFIRSLGLGSDFVRPWSLVLDRAGIYFDPARCSDLERLLNHTEFTEPLLKRAAALRSLIRQYRITKYNVEPDEALALDADNRLIVLVPGQVEDDASVKRGGGELRTNEALLRAVRRDRPDAYLLFKPHPDVLAGNREGRARMESWAGLCDRIETRQSIIRCIEAADEVHTLTSLAGFDALLRDKRVVTYGRPFYAGWGLTEDRARFERPRRVLSLDQLVAGTLLLYPRYWDPEARCFVEAEDVVNKFVERRSSANRRRCGGFRKWLTYVDAVALSLRETS